jgi:hypothetical protein
LDRSAWATAGVTIVAVFVGALIPVLTDVFRGPLERKQRIQDRRDDFQRGTLLDLQDALYRFMLGANLIRVNIQQEQSGKRPQEWAALGDPGEMTQEAAPRISMLIERVQDERLRNLVSDFMTGYSVVLIGSRSDEEAISTLDTMHRIQLLANKRIGELLRQL